MLWFKALHIFFVVAWFAGLFYLPRLFLYHAATEDLAGRERFKQMERKLFAMMTIGAVFTVIFGGATLSRAPGYLQQPWMHAKLALVVLLLGYHLWCYRLLLAFRCDANTHSQRWYRLFNEVPTVLLLAIVWLITVKPALR
jgi:protoporphyrinogen IX oxidase